MSGDAAVDRTEAPANEPGQGPGPATRAPAPAKNGPGGSLPASPRAQRGAVPGLQVEAQARPGGLDASEGTPRDPLLNRTYDLNSPHTVPALKPF
jgi:UPF0755 protein